tara:strand:+ start:219 stop:2432 length:2214 start_codon:yes stop_codon:yes gene_type:complete
MLLIRHIASKSAPNVASSRPLYALLIALLLSACGGGGGDSSPTTFPVVATNNAPVVSAGDSQIALVSSPVVLSGAASDADGSIASYSWTQTSGTTVTLSGADTASATFTSPATAGALQFRLTVTDNQGATTSSFVSIDVSLPPNNAPLANAGDDQSTAILSTVTLAGSGTDADGTVVSYSWQQTSGETVTLINGSSATATFTAPNNEATLVFGLTVTDNSGSIGTDSTTVNITDQRATLSGDITFDLVPFSASGIGLDYGNIVSSPSRGVVVEAVDDAGLVLASTVTDATGGYELRVDTNPSLRIRISAKLLQTSGATWDIKVSDNTASNALYAVQGDLFATGSGTTVRNFHMPSGWDGASYSAPRAAAPFAVLDAMYETVQKFATVDASLQLPALEIHWSENNAPADGNLSDGDIGTSFYSGGKIYLLGKAGTDSDEYDRHVLIHEWGHYFEDQLSRSDSIGGGHSLSDRLDMRVAFSEGLANGLSGIVTDDPFYRDSSGSQQGSGFSFSLDRNTYTNSGWFNEGSVQSLVYDIYDAGNDGVDTLTLGLGPIYNALVDSNYRSGDYFTSIFSFIARLKAEQPAAQAQINSLVAGQTINGIQANGTNETNSGELASALPVYKVATIGGSAIQLCSTDDLGYFNKLGNTVFVEFNLPSAGTYGFSATEVGGATLSDPDFLIYKSGTLVYAAESGVIGSETASISFDNAGTHVLAFYDWNNIDETDDVGDYCFDFQISN